MKSAINKLFWGFILIFFNVNIGSFDLLPDFVGYIIIVNGLMNLRKLSDDEASHEFKIATILGNCMVVFSILEWFIPTQSINNMYGYGPDIWIIIFNGLSISIAYSLDYFILKGLSIMLYNINYKELADTSKTLKELILGVGIITLCLTSFTINFSYGIIIESISFFIAIVTLIINIYYLYFIRKIYKALD